MAHFFGGRVAPAQGGWAVGVHTSKIVGGKIGWTPIPATVSVALKPQNQVAELPDGAEVFATDFVR